MKKRFNVLLAAALLTGWGVAGCYEDKGNYDYREVNEMTVTFSVQDGSGRTFTIDPSTGITRFKRVGQDTNRIVYTALVNQSMKDDESNLEYVWAVSGGDRTDTVLNKELVLNVPPSDEDITYSMAFRITDLSTNISYYKNFRLQMVTPYAYSWFVLNGKMGFRQISAVENPDSTGYTFTLDAWTDMGNTPRFRNATDLVYTPTLRNYQSDPETLMVIESEEDNIVAKLSPFRMQVMGEGRELLPDEFVNSRRKVVYSLDGNRETSMMVIVDELGLGYYFNNSDGRFQQFDSKDIGVYGIEKIGGMNESNHLVFWDKDKKFRYIGLNNTIQPIESDTKWEEVDEVLWMGQTNQQWKGEGGIAMALVRDSKTKEYSVYNFSGGDGVTYKEWKIGALDIDKDSQFAASSYFPGRLFYTMGSRLFVCNTVTGEKNEVYNAGNGTIVQLKFRMDQEPSIPAYKNSCYHLGIAVNMEETGELHDVVLSGGGDFESVKVFTGFGPIQDMCFTYVDRVI